MMKARSVCVRDFSFCLFYPFFCDWLGCIGNTIGKYPKVGESWGKLAKVVQLFFVLLQPGKEKLKKDDFLLLLFYAFFDLLWFGIILVDSV